MTVSKKSANVYYIFKKYVHQTFDDKSLLLLATSLCLSLVSVMKFALRKYSFISIQPWRPGFAGTRAQSCDRYGSGTLHAGQVLGGSLPLLSSAFRRSHFSRQVPPSATTREILAAKGGTVGEKDFHVNLGIFYMLHIYDMGPTALLPLRRKAC